MDSPRRLPVRRLRGAVLASCALAFGPLIAAPAAQAAYAPQLSVKIDPATAGQPIALTSAVTQAPTEEANKRVTVSFPVGVGFVLKALDALPACTPAQFAAKSCPEGSRIGSAEADAAIGTLKGNVYFGYAGDSPAIYVFLSNSLSTLLGQDQALTGVTTFRKDSGIDTTFDNLPNTTTTRFELHLDGPPVSILQAPTTCGAFNFDGTFLGQDGSTATSRSTVSVSGCPSPPLKLGTLKLRPRRVRQGRTSKLSFVLDASASVTVTIRRVGKRRVQATRHLSGHTGTNSLRLGRGYKPGTYIVRVSAVDSSGSTATHALRLKVMAPPKRRR